MLIEQQITTWIAVAILFMLASVFSERTAKYGYVLIPITTGLFAYFGWLEPKYMAVVVPLLLSLGAITFLKEQFRVKLGGYGQSGSLLWKIVSFMMLIQVAIVMVASMGAIGLYESKDLGTLTLYSASPEAAKSFSVNEITNATAPFAIQDASLTDQVWFGFTIAVTGFALLIDMILVIPKLYWILTGAFGFSPVVAVAASGIVYIMFAWELIALVTRSPPKET